MKIFDLNNISVEMLLILLFTFLSFACEEVPVAVMLQARRYLRVQ